MSTTVNKMIEETKEDVGIYHHVDGCYTVIGPVPEGLPLRSKVYDKDGSPLLLRGIVKADAPPAVYDLQFQTIDSILIVEPDVKPKAQKAKKDKPKKASKDDNDIDDTYVDSMT